jgi:hypothetical protein
MPWGCVRKRKREGEDEDLLCQECEDTWIYTSDHEPFTICGDCQRTMCEYCSQHNCNYEDCLACETLGYSSICKACMKYCSDCDNSCFHEKCLIEHLKICDKKSRAQRAPSEVEYTIATIESQLADANSQLTTIQERIGSLERQLENKKKEKAVAEIKLKAEDAAAKEE